MIWFTPFFRLFGRRNQSLCYGLFQRQSLAGCIRISYWRQEIRFNGKIRVSGHIHMVITSFRL